MDLEIKSLVVTISFAIVLLILFIWLLRALMPSTRKEAHQAARDEYDTAGYETMDQIRRKEYSVLGLGGFVILLSVAMVGGLGYLLWTSGFSSDPSDQEGMNTILVFIPAIVMLVMIVMGSRRYIRHQEGVLHEYRVFKSKREKAIQEYEAMRSGKDKEDKKPGGSKVQTGTRRERGPQTTGQQKRRGPPKR
ncbi:MAG: MFS transporter [Candidatus Glassbacteria bacterium]|nr:MFS transporter [Candidatus Glassbacteria bacterium]